MYVITVGSHLEVTLAMMEWTFLCYFLQINKRKELPL